MRKYSKLELFSSSGHREGGMEGLEPVPIPAETRPAPEDKKQQSPIIRLAKSGLKSIAIGSVIWCIMEILVTLLFPAHVERWDIADYEIMTQNSSLSTRVSIETSLAGYNQTDYNQSGQRKTTVRKSGNSCWLKNDDIDTLLKQCVRKTSISPLLGSHPRTGQM